MKKTVITLALLLAVSTAWAQSLEGKKITVTGGDLDSVNAPVSIAFKGAPPKEPIQVIDAQGKAYPATVADGQLVFVLEKLAAKEKAVLTVKAAKQAPPKVEIRKEGDKPELKVSVGGQYFTSYRHSNDERKPYLWPVMCEGDKNITRDWPMIQDAPGNTKDHVHHKGIWTSFGEVNDVDCWGETGGRAGFQHTDEVTFASGDALGWIKAKNTWQDKDHKPVIAEEREYKFYDTPAGARTFDETVTFTAKYGDVLFKDTKEGGLLAYRIRDDLCESNNDKEAGAKIVGKGVMTNAEGKVGEKECWGKPSPWTDYAGPIEGLGVRGIAVFDNPQNLRYPTTWHIRGYGLNGANCFGLSYFTNKEKNGDFTLENGKSVTFTYRVVIHSGDAKEAKLAERNAAFAAPLKAEWAK